MQKKEKNGRPGKRGPFAAAVAWLLSAAMAAAVCIAGTGMAAAADGTSEDAVPRAVFTNAEPTTPDLYVGKEVEDADSRYPSDPDTEFSFVLRLDGELAKKLEYEVYDENNEKVTKTESGVEVPYRTDSNGGFTLKAGQRAKFTYVGEGVSYEVTETDLPDGYTLVSPAGAAAGTVDSDGAFVTFTNRYVPEEPETPQDEEETTLSVTKQVSWPDGYEYDTDAEFPFILTIDGEAYAAEAYGITAADGSESSGTTDADGRFTLKAGETATFTVPLSVDYSITEEVPDGWTAYGGSTQKGATTYPLTEALFTNVSASFAVAKETDTGTDESFTFLLYDGSGTAWAGQAYWLYGSDGVRADTETYQTDADGKFTLKAGQTAMFFGIPEGTAYSVMEQKAEGWTQALPLSADGYTGKSVLASVEVLKFKNEKEELEEGSLSVSKTVESSDGSTVDTSDEFPFILYVDDAPLASAVYSITAGNAVKTYKTDDEGRFTLHANQTAVFTGLEAGRTYKIEEDLGSMGNPAYSIAEESRVQEAELTDTLSFAFVNTYTPYGQIALTKADAETGEKLKGAVYGIYRDEACTDLAEEVTTGMDGSARSGNLDPGTYYVKETKAPVRYALSDTVYTAEVEAEKIVSVHDDGSEYVLDNALTGSITLRKHASDGETPLAGVTFELTDSGGNVTSATTGDDGVAAFTGLAAGSYTVAETKTVSGYSLLSGTISATIPLEVTKAQAEADSTIDTSLAVYDGENGTYLFYDISYDVTDNAAFVMPTAGSQGFPIKVGLVGLAAVTAGVCLAIRRRKQKAGLR